jgi:ribosomal protein L32|tara:strand:+ start:626 stop:880 length:255 start_codon:yes stop_codon:yes gene_type:complete
MKDELPPLHEQAQNLFKDLGGIIANYTKTGKVRASNDVIKERLQACVTCENYNAEKKRCKSCGCYTNKKVLFESIKCPKDKWRE